MERIDIEKLWKDLKTEKVKSREENIKHNEHLKDFLDTNGLSLESDSFSILCLKQYMELGHNLPPEETLELHRIYLTSKGTAPIHLFSEFIRNTRDKYSVDI